jgi:hypothetical protein
VRGARAVLLMIAVLLSYSGCSKDPVTPTPVTNTPPVIDSVTVDATHVEAEDEVQLTAVVRDTETAVGQLTYTWAIAPSRGTLVGSGAQVRWRAPSGATTPDQYTFTLTVTERYTSAGVQKTNEVSKSVQTRYNDSVPEISNLVTVFLNEFSNDSISPEQCIRNFSDSCVVTKAMELQDVKNQRDCCLAIASIFTITNVTLNSNRTSADILAPCEFRSQNKMTGMVGSAKGTCRLTAVYESFRWWLCESRFFGDPGLRPSAAHP